MIKAKHGLFRAKLSKAPGFNNLLIDSASSRSSGELRVHQFGKPLMKFSLKEKWFLIFPGSIWKSKSHIFLAEIKMVSPN